jgi:membrane protein implicated in regulation of membrane protease activity
MLEARGPIPIAPWRRIVTSIGGTFSHFVISVRRHTGNSFLMSCIVAGLLTAAGFGAFYLAWRGAAATLVVAVQISYLISGGLTGLALLTTGIGILSIQTTRRFAAHEDRELDNVLDKALKVLAEVKRDGGLR